MMKSRTLTGLTVFTALGLMTVVPACSTSESNSGSESDSGSGGTSADDMTSDDAKPSENDDMPSDDNMMPSDDGMMNPPAPTCDDGELNQDESDVDCGGSCDPCGVGNECSTGADCASGSCAADWMGGMGGAGGAAPMGATCLAASCHDGVENGNETDVDCGGDCLPCADLKQCATADDCVSGVCGDTNTCAEPTCGDGVKNGSEECDDKNDVDDDACSDLCILPTCEDGKKNGDETAQDCGGSCGGCALGEACTEAQDCSTGACDNDKCVHPTSCKGVFDNDNGAASSVYSIDLDGDGGNAAESAYCDMTTAGGGWTLAFATKHIMGNANADPGPSLPDSTQQLPTNFAAPDALMERHRVPATATELLWMCDTDGTDSTLHWWQTSTPSTLTNATHDAGLTAVTVTAQSENASVTPTGFVEGSDNYPTWRYMFLSNNEPNSCGDQANSAWGSSCLGSNTCGSPTGYCASYLTCDGVAVTPGTARFWLFYR